MQVDLPRMKIPSQIDPFSIAFLRGGDSEVMRTAMVELVESGWIVQEAAPTGLKKWTAAKTPKWKTDYQGRSVDSLGELQRLIAKHFEIAQPATSVFQETLMAKARSINEPYRKWVYQEQLWNPPKSDPKVTRWLIWACVVLESLAVYKFFHAMTEHRNNVGFLAAGMFRGLVRRCARSSMRSFRCVQAGRIIQAEIQYRVWLEAYR
jgi:uncharacterized protein (TIGR04222 family)